MDSFEEDVTDSLKSLNRTVEELVFFFSQDFDFTKRINTHWNAKDILGHLVFWHESFERNLRCVASGIKPNVLKGKLSEVNKQSVDSTCVVEIATHIDRLRKAQIGIQKNIVDTSVSLIPYKKGSRDYSRLEHLNIVDAL